MFVDKVKVKVEAGNGGNGAVSFRHEIYVDKGGPDGGDGGRGGNIILQASRNQNTLAAFRYQKLIKAENGQNGSKSNKHGRSGKDLNVAVPVGTVVIGPEGEELADLKEDGFTFKLAEGGYGGFGNAHFTSSVRQAPRVAEVGEKGQKFDCLFELRMIADAGLIGLPNAGKSSLLTAISNARPEVANYPFTTLVPNLGVVDVGGESILLADIPGLIEGASDGKGLGDEFLRHVSRCDVLLHLIDTNSNDIVDDYKTIRSELAAYDPKIAKKPEIIVLTKADTLTQDIIDMQVQLLKPALKARTKVFVISSYSKQGLDKLLFAVKQIIDKNRTKKQKIIMDAPEIPVIKLPDALDHFKVKKIDSGFMVTGRKIERFAHRTDFTNEHGIRRIRDICKKMGILNELKKQKIEADDEIIFGSPMIGKIIY